MNLCFLALDYPSASGGGGVGNQVRSLGQALAHAGHRVSVVTFVDGISPASEQDNGIDVFRVTLGNVHWYISKFPWLGQLAASGVRELEQAWAVFKIVQQLHRERPIDVIEGTEHGALFVAMCMKRVPLAIRLHGERYTSHKYTPDEGLTVGLRATRLLQRVALRRARILISPSQGHAREISRELDGRHPPIEVVNNLLGLSFLLSTEEGRAHGPCAAHGPVILYVGRLARPKGIPLLLEAAREVMRHEPDVQFVLAGAHHPTLPKTEFNDLLDRHYLRQNVQVLGHVRWEELADLYRSADICVLPSYYETFGVAALEPMVFGIPVVASAVGGLPEVVTDEVTGILVPPGDCAALSTALMRLLRDTDLRRRLGDAGRASVAARFDADGIVAANVELYHRVAQLPDDRVTADHVFLSPHFDDAVLSSGGLIASLVREGQTAKVVTVFAHSSETAGRSSFVGHLHAKWGTGDAQRERLEEDDRAMDHLGVRAVERWEFMEAPYRSDPSGDPLYASYEALCGPLRAEDEPLVNLLQSRVEDIARSHRRTIFYVPLGLGGHVDHQLLYRLGLRMASSGYSVRFYEEWPYAEVYKVRRSQDRWLYQTADIAVQPKIDSALQYVSQVRGLGGSQAVASKRLERYARRVGDGTPRERFWSLPPTDPTSPTLDGLGSALPLRRRTHRTVGWRQPIRRVRQPGLESVLPVGSGMAIVCGENSASYRSLIAGKGYRLTSSEPMEIGDYAGLQIRDASERVSAIVIPHLEDLCVPLESVARQVVMALQSGGVFCAQISPVESMYSRAALRPSGTALRSLLRKHGFEDIRVYAAPLVISTVASLFLRWRKETGTGRLDRSFIRLSTTIFVARKGARAAACTSDS
jgi:glycosyltransferase involved in cell wall biosynthesis/LmbE family N-acetylglucosaminyl deacetylase